MSIYCCRLAKRLTKISFDPIGWEAPVAEAPERGKKINELISKQTSNTKSLVKIYPAIRYCLLFPHQSLIFGLLGAEQQFLADSFVRSKVYVQPQKTTLQPFSSVSCLSKASKSP